MKFLSALLFVLLYSSVSAANVSTYDSLFIEKAQKHGVDPILLKTLVMKESSFNPYALNINGEGFSFKSKGGALRGLRHVVSRPYIFKVYRYKGNKLAFARKFFKSDYELQKYLSLYIKKTDSFNLPIIRSLKDSHKGEGERIIARKLNVESTDMGLAQINYRYHDAPNLTVSDWLEPDINIEYQAKLISRLIKRHPDKYTAIAHYHSSTEEFQKIYLRSFKADYNRIKNDWNNRYNSKS